MPKFRKKPVVIEAIQVTDANLSDLLALDRSNENVHVFCQQDGTGAVMNRTAWVNIDTLEGTMRADRDDWIITGVNGEVYPCKPDVFEKTYDPVEE